MPTTIDSVLATTPLTEEEKQKGSALRLARCVRSAEGDFSEGPSSYLWVVLRFRREGSRGASRPTCLALRGNGRYLPNRVRRIAPSLLATHRITLGADPWAADEYSFPAEIEERRLVVLCGRDRLVIGRGARDAAIDEYGRIIANASVDTGYPSWLEARRADLSARPAPSGGPLMSIVTPAFKTPPAFLRKMLESVLAQSYTNWELVVVNASPGDEAMREVFSEYADPRIKVVETPENLGITGNTNFGLSRCAGDYISFFDHDDTVEPYALAQMVERINGAAVKPGLLYCDEDNIDENDEPSLPLLKPDFNEDFLLSNNYVIHWLTVRRDLLQQVELSGKDVEGAQDYDMTFKIAELGAPTVHIPEVLYHWRIHSGSTAGNPAQKSYAQDAGAKAINNHLARQGVAGKAERGRAYFTYKTSFEAPSPLPAVELVCDGAPAEKTAAALEAYAAMAGTTDTDGEAGAASLALVVTKDHELGLEDLLALVQYAARPGVFSVSPRVIRQDGLFDYASSVVAPDGSVTRLLRFLPDEDGGYVGRSERPMDAVAGNPECCLVRLDVAHELGLSVGAPDAQPLLDAFVLAWSEGKKNVYLPYATARLAAPRSLLDELVRTRLSTPVARDVLSHGFSDPSFNPSFDAYDAYYKLHR